MQGRSKRRSLELPETVVEDILSKLPVKSLLRFRCVCKPWCSSFQTLDFITRHYQNNLKNNHLNLLLKSSLAIDDVDYFSALSTEKGDNFLVKENIDILCFHTGWLTSVVYGPCKGLFCLSYDGEAALWNPSTREFKFLPQSSLQRHPSVLFTASGCLGFGFDSKTDDYKIVRFVTYNIVQNEEECMPDESIPKVELYSLKSDSWKEISDPGTKPFCPPLFNSYIDGLYYWKVAGNSDCFVLSFDMAKEEFSTFPPPKFGGSLDQCDLQLLDFNGSLSAIVYPKKGIEKSFDLWVMMSGSWTRKFCIQSIYGVERPLGFWKNGELFLEGSNGELVLFDPASREHKNLGFHGHLYTMQLIAYLESLVPINGHSENDMARQPGKKVNGIFLLSWGGLVIIRMQIYGPAEMVQILAISAPGEELVVDEESLAFLGEIGQNTSLRYAVQLLLPASIVAKMNGRDSICKADLEEVSRLYIDAQSSAKILQEQQEN